MERPFSNLDTKPSESRMEHQGRTNSRIETISNLSDFLREYDDEALVNNCIQSVTFDSESQTMIIKMQELVVKETDAVEKRLSRREELALRRIRDLSRTCKEKYPKLVESFQKWKPAREQLIELLRGSSSALRRNSSVVSSIRIVTAVADIVGTAIRVGGGPDGTWSDFAMEHASTVGMCCLFLEMTLSKKYHNDVKNAILEDKKLFEDISKWFQQTQELEDAVRDFFPYGIDEEIVKKIENKTDCSYYNKIFMSIVASNVKRDIKLFQDKGFLDAANRFAREDAGKEWFSRILLGNDVMFTHCLNACLCNQIQSILNISPSETAELSLDGYRLMTISAKKKIVLNAMTIISSGYNLLWGKNEESNAMADLAVKGERELNAIEKLLRFLMH